MQGKQRQRQLNTELSHGCSVASAKSSAFMVVNDREAENSYQCEYSLCIAGDLLFCETRIRKLALFWKS